MLSQLARNRNLFRNTPQLIRPFGTGMGGGMSAKHSSNSADALDLWETENRSGFLITLNDKPGQLAHVLNILNRHNIDLTQIQSKPPKVVSGTRTMNVHIDFVGTFKDANVLKCA